MPLARSGILPIGRCFATLYALPTGLIEKIDGDARV